MENPDDFISWSESQKSLNQKDVAQFVIGNNLAPQYGIIVNIEYKLGKVTYQYAVFLDSNPSGKFAGTDASTLTRIHSVSQIPIEILKGLVRFDNRFREWLNGEVLWKGLCFDSKEEFCKERDKDNS